MLVYVYAYEGMYQGLHGIYESDVLEVSDNDTEAMNEINEWGAEASDELISSYGLEDEYLAEIEDFEEEEDYDITDTNYYCNRGWLAYKVRKDVNLSFEELRQEAGQHDLDGFIELYCEEMSYV